MKDYEVTLKDVIQQSVMQRAENTRFGCRGKIVMKISSGQAVDVSVYYGVTVRSDDGRRDVSISPSQISTELEVKWLSTAEFFGYQQDASIKEPTCGMPSVLDKLITDISTQMGGIRSRIGNLKDRGPQSQNTNVTDQHEYAILSSKYKIDITNVRQGRRYATPQSLDIHCEARAVMTLGDTRSVDTLVSYDLQVIGKFTTYKNFSAPGVAAALAGRWEFRR